MPNRLTDSTPMKLRSDHVLVSVGLYLKAAGIIWMSIDDDLVKNNSDS